MSDIPFISSIVKNAINVSIGRHYGKCSLTDVDIDAISEAVAKAFEAYDKEKG